MTYSVPQDMSSQGVPEVEQETRQDWWFTFGSGQSHNGRYVVIHGTHAEARDEMIAHFGARWCDQYRTAERAGVDEFDLIELLRPFWPEPVAEFEVDVAGHIARLEAERAAQDCSGCRDILTRDIEELASGGAAALRADVVTSVLEQVEALRQDIPDLAESMFEGTRGPSEGDLLARLDRIAALVRGEEQ